MTTELIQQVQQALNRLGDPTYLEVHPLTASAPADEPGASPGARLRSWLIGSIERLRPVDGESGAPTLMERRYVAGKSVVRVCRDLGLSESEYYRQHRRALAAVAAMIADGARPAVAGATQAGSAEAGSPAADAAERRTNLPHRPTSFVGREHELAEARRLLSSTPLLTLVGPPGIGKTRLALEIASRAADVHPDGVWLIELAALTEPALVPQVVAQALGVREAAGQPLDEALSAHFRDRLLLLVLDNCEHLVDACAVLLDRMLRDGPRARVLATSREPLRVEGEVAYRLAPLPLPPERFVVSPEQLERSAAGQLFIGRARAVDAAFAVTPAEADVVARICRRLDGIALAIELAAARVGALSLAEIEARLDDRFRLLTAGRRAALPRQQTLEALIDFSHDLLSPPERALLRRLALFAGAFEIAAAREVCADDELPAEEVADLLAQLVDKSLVLFDRGGGRYRLLETIRAYALARLDEAGETGRVRDRQRDRLRALVAEAEPQLALGGTDRARWVDVIEGELDDVRAVLRGCVADDPEAALGIALGLLHFWWGNAYEREGSRWLSEALAAADPTSPSRPRALMAASFLARVTGDPRRARQLAEESVPLLVAAGDHAGAALALENLGMIAASLGDRASAVELLERAVALAREADDRPTLGTVLRSLGHLTVERGDDAAGAAHLEDSLALLRALGDEVGASQTLAYLGEVAAARGEHDRARALLDEGLAAARGARYLWGEAFNALALGRALHLAGDLASARAATEEALALVRRIGVEGPATVALRQLGDLARAEGDHGAAHALYDDTLSTARQHAAMLETEGRALAEIAELARRGGEPERAAAELRSALRCLPRVGYALAVARCLALAAAIRMDAGAADDCVRLAAAARTADALVLGRLCPDERSAQEAMLVAARRSLGDSGFSAAWDDGSGISVDRAVQLALDAIAGPVPARPSGQVSGI